MRLLVAVLVLSSALAIAVVPGPASAVPPRCYGEHEHFVNLDAKVDLCWSVFDPGCELEFHLRAIADPAPGVYAFELKTVHARWSGTMGPDVRAVAPADGEVWVADGDTVTVRAEIHHLFVPEYGADADQDFTCHD